MKRRFLKMLTMGIVLLTLLAPGSTAVTAEAAGRGLIRIAQGKLQLLGFDCGEEDGEIGAATQRQLSAYQTERGLKVTGTLSDETIRSLHLPTVLSEMETKFYPYSAVMLVEAYFGSEFAGQGTAFIIGPRTLLTCAHVVYDEESDSFAREVYLAAGFYEGNYKEVIEVTDYEIMPNYFIDGSSPLSLLANVDPRYDVAVLHVGEDLTSRYGSFDLVRSGENFSKTEAMTTGYPKGTFCRSEGQVFADVQGMMYADDIFSLPGGSGSPLFLKSGQEESTVIGILTSGIQFENWANDLEAALGFNFEDFGVDPDALGVTLGGIGCVSLSGSSVNRFIQDRVR